jgi:hypothetical protein
MQNDLDLSVAPETALRRNPRGLVPLLSNGPFQRPTRVDNAEKPPKGVTVVWAGQRGGRALESCSNDRPPPVILDAQENLAVFRRIEVIAHFVNIGN